jgi:hypothetical protein
MNVMNQLAGAIEDRIAALPWGELGSSISESGYAETPQLLTSEECAEVRNLYARDELFRSQIIMERFRFGRGDYKYFNYPLPELVRQFRTATYPYLATIANEWSTPEDPMRFPERLDEFLARCHRAGQKRATPLILHYEQGGYNCLHQDIYGTVAFPLQMVVMLGQQGRDWEGGEFVLVEQRPRAQSKAEVVTPDEGHGVIFTTRYRPVRGTKGFYRVNLKHGVGRVRRGSRYTLGIIFHDAE